MIKTVIFDCDGVLVDSEYVCYECYERAGREHGFVFTLDLYRNFVGSSFADITPEVRACFPADEQVYRAILDDGRRYTEERLLNPVPLKPHVREVLDELKEAGYALYIVSSTLREGLHKRLDPHGLYAYFDGVISGDMVHRRKPDPEIYDLCAGTYRISKDQAVVIEDSENGILSAYRAGYKVICVADLWPMDHMQEKGMCVCAEDLPAAVRMIRENRI